MKQYIATLMDSRTQAHVYHLQTKSYEIHKALNTYYDDIVDLIDDLVEAYQGKYGIISEYEFIVDIKNLSSEGDILNYFTALAKYCEKRREMLPGDSYLKNHYDEIDSLIRKTIYKIKNLG